MLSDILRQINEAASSYHVGGLQQLRRKLHGRGTRTGKIFSRATVFVEEGYAFHDGGRKELQFNVGVENLDQQRWWRHGVAFSFEPNQNLPDPTILAPKVRLFNEWVRAHGDALRGFQMWDWIGKEERSADRSPGEITAEAILSQRFVFLGTRIPETEVSVDRILEDFDRLTPCTHTSNRVQSSSILKYLRRSRTIIPTWRHTLPPRDWLRRSMSTSVTTKYSSHLSIYCDASSRSTPSCTNLRPRPGAELMWQ